MKYNPDCKDCRKDKKKPRVWTAWARVGKESGDLQCGRLFVTRSDARGMCLPEQRPIKVRITELKAGDARGGEE